MQCLKTFGIHLFCDFDKAYRAHLAKVEKNKQEGKEDDPSNKCKLNFRNKKYPQQSFELRYHDFITKNNAYSFLRWTSLKVLVNTRFLMTIERKRNVEEVNFH